MFVKKCNSCDGIYDSLDVRFTKHCDNSCKFCIEKDGLEALTMAPPEKLIDSTLATSIKSILILGGEPLLFPARLYEYVRGIRSKVDEIYLTTSLPAATTKAADTFDLLDGINVSIQSTDWLENNRILRAHYKHNRLLLLASLLERWQDKIRVNLNLVKGYIDSKEKLIKALEELQAIGCKKVKVNELQHAPDSFISFEKMIDCKIPSPFAHGCQTPIEIEGIHMDITLKRSCFLVEPTKSASIMDLLKVFARRKAKYTNRFAVMYENGEVYNEWKKKGE